MVRSDDTRPFTNAVDIDFQLRARLLQLEDEDYFIGQDPTAFAINAATLLRDLNTIHAFADGNGRTQRVFLRHLAKQAGYELNWRADGTNREALVQDQYIAGELSIEEAIAELDKRCKRKS